MVDFRKETERYLELLSDEVGEELVVDEVKIEIWGSNGSDMGIYVDRDQIDWMQLITIYGKDNFLYDAGYGSQVFDGWITFKNTSAWLEREEYDGSEHWVIRRRPEL